MQLPATAQPPDEVTKPKRLGYSYRRHLGERFIEALLFLMAFVSVAITDCHRGDAGKGVICIF